MARRRASRCRRALCACAAGRCRQRPPVPGPQAAVDEAEQCRIGAAGGACRARGRRLQGGARSGRVGGRAWSRARAPSCCSPISRRPTAATRAVCGSISSKAVRAPRDPAWVADGVVSEQWAPVSPVTGRLDAFEWRAPVERLGQLIESGRRWCRPACRDALIAGSSPRADGPRPRRHPRCRRSDAGTCRAAVAEAALAAAPAFDPANANAPGARGSDSEARDAAAAGRSRCRPARMPTTRKRAVSVCSDRRINAMRMLSSGHGDLPMLDRLISFVKRLPGGQGGRPTRQRRRPARRGCGADVSCRQRRRRPAGEREGQAALRAVAKPIR